MSRFNRTTYLAGSGNTQRKTKKATSAISHGPVKAVHTNDTHLYSNVPSTSVSDYQHASTPMLLTSNHRALQQGVSDGLYNQPHASDNVNSRGRDPVRNASQDSRRKRATSAPKNRTKGNASDTSQFHRPSSAERNPRQSPVAWGMNEVSHTGMTRGTPDSSKVARVSNDRFHPNQHQLSQQDIKYTNQKDAEEIERLEVKLSARDRDIIVLNSKISELEDAKQMAQAKIESLESYSPTSKQRLSNHTDQSFESEYDNLAQILAKVTEVSPHLLTSHRRDINSLNEQIQQKDAKIKQLQDSLPSKNSNRELEWERYSKTLQRRLDEQTRQFEQVNASLNESKKRVEVLSQKLAAEMGTKVASNETSIENVSIKYRPTKVAEVYTNFTSQEWFNAKTFLDETTKKATEEKKLNFLCDILLDASVVAREMHSQAIDQVSTVLSNPVSHQRDSGQEKLPAQILNVIGDYLRTTAESTHLENLIRRIHGLMNEKHSNLVSFVRKYQESYILWQYVEACAGLAWKMAVQRPPMTFSIAGKSKPFDEKTQEIFWSSDDPRSGAVVTNYVWPALSHGQTLMVKGKVLLKRKNFKETTM